MVVSLQVQLVRYVRLRHEFVPHVHRIALYRIDAHVVWVIEIITDIDTKFSSQVVNLWSLHVHISDLTEFMGSNNGSLPSHKLERSSEFTGLSV